MTTWTSLVLFLICTSLALAQTDDWELMNGPFGGSVYSIAGDSSDVLYAGLYTRYVYRSLDGGEHWEELPAAHWTVNAIVVRPDRTVLLGTDYSGIRRSTDLGNTWSTVAGLWVGSTIQAMCSNGQGVLYAAPQQDGIYRSIDGGVQWTACDSGLTDNNVYGIAAGPGDTVFAGTGTGIFRSTNGGDFWVRLGLPDQDVFAIGCHGSRLYAGTYMNGVYLSTDRGGTWTPIGLRTQYVNTLLVSPDGSLLAGVYSQFAQGGAFAGIYRTTDNGLRWDNVAMEEEAGNTIFALPSGDLVAATSGGVIRSSDGGVTWCQKNRGLFPAQVNSLLARADGLMLAGTQGFGIFRSTDFGESWRWEVLWGDDIYSLAFSPTGIPYAGTYRSGLQHTTDGGDLWWAAGFYNAVTRFAFDSSGVIHLVSGGNLYRSTDNGLTWPKHEIAGAFVTTVSSDPQSRLFAGTFESGVYVSTSGGSSWTPSGLSGKEISSFAFVPSGVLAGTKDGVYLAAGPFQTWRRLGLADTFVVHVAVANGLLYAATFEDGMYRSTDMGSSWQPLNAGLANLEMLAIVPGAGGQLYASNMVRSLSGTPSGGLYRLRPGTTAGDSEPTGFPHVFRLEQNYPNPFNSTTTIRFALPARSRVTLTVFNVLGQSVRVLVDGERDAGYHEVRLEASALTSGVYLCRLETLGRVQSMKMMLLR